MHSNFLLLSIIVFNVHLLYDFFMIYHFLSLEEDDYLYFMTFHHFISYVFFYFSLFSIFFIFENYLFTHRLKLFGFLMLFNILCDAIFTIMYYFDFYAYFVLIFLEMPMDVIQKIIMLPLNAILFLAIFIYFYFFLINYFSFPLKIIYLQIS
jgi:hypothetical protein